jgi:hypothetical protein
VSICERRSKQIWRFYPDPVSRDEFREGLQSQEP